MVALTNKQESPGVQPEAFDKPTNKPRKFSAKSTATEAQWDRIVKALRVRPQSSYDLRRLGCYQAPARVKELRDRFGFLIETTPITIVDSDGYTHPRAALYTLVSEPSGWDCGELAQIGGANG